VHTDKTVQAESANEPFDRTIQQLPLHWLLETDNVDAAAAKAAADIDAVLHKTGHQQQGKEQQIVTVPKNVLTMCSLGVAHTIKDGDWKSKKTHHMTSEQMR
jgi:hypothetical protein